MNSVGEAQIVEQWAAIYNAVYTTDGQHTAPDFTGWRSSITGENYSEDETAEWLDGTVAEISRLAPRHVLEVGAGSGLVARGLLPYIDSYVGTDISVVAVERMAATYRDRPDSRFVVRAADEITDLGQFDVVVLNSVVHHFPSVEYLRRALAQAVGACGPGGAVFIGDVHSLPLRDALRLCILAARSPGEMTVRRVTDWLAGQAARERELVLDPAFFAAVAAEFGLVADIQLKPGRCGTEMNLFRYDVRLRPGTDSLIAPDAAPRLRWHAGGARLVEEVAAAGQPTVLAGVAHPGLTPSVSALATVRRRDPDASVDVAALIADRRPAPGPAGIAPADLRVLAARHGLACYCTPAAPGRYDAVLAPSPESGGRHVGLAIAPTGGADRVLATSPDRPEHGPAGGSHERTETTRTER